MQQKQVLANNVQSSDQETGPKAKEAVLMIENSRLAHLASPQQVPWVDFKVCVCVCVKISLLLQWVFL